jgi:hypothetical protein
MSAVAKAIDMSRTTIYAGFVEQRFAAQSSTNRVQAGDNVWGSELLTTWLNTAHVAKFP